MENQAIPDTASRYRIEGMDCPSCTGKIETALRRIDGVSEIRTNATAETLSARFANPQAKRLAEKQIKLLGYGVTELDKVDQSSGKSSPKLDTPWWKSRRAILTGASGATLAAAYATGKIFPPFEALAFTGAMAIGLLPIAQRAFAAARAGSPFSIEMLMTIAAAGAVVIGAAEEAAVVVFLFLIGELLENVAANRARASIRALSDLLPKTAVRVRDKSTETVDAAELRFGDVILVRPGDRVAADGEIIHGESELDEAPVTGESVPKRKVKGDSVFAGTINGSSALTVRVSATAVDNTISRIIRLVEEAQESKAPTQRFIDRFSQIYTPAVVIFAALVAVTPPLLLGASWSEWIYKGLATLLIGCPCALVISTPAAIAASLSAGARRGLLLKGGAALEVLRKVTVVAFDKTGTLTEGRPQVTDVIAGSRDARLVLALAASLEQGSSHPLANAILARAKADNVPVPPVSQAKALAGKGVTGSVGGESVFLGSVSAAKELSSIDEQAVALVARLHGEGKTVSILLVDSVFAGLIAMRDEPRDDAKAGLQRLRNAGMKTLMLTGDNKVTAAAVGEALGIEPHGELLPQDKMEIIKNLKARGERVAKVGDGINDAPALAAADIGIAMGNGTDVALETADAAILHGRVGDVAAMIDLSQRTMLNIYQNITIALGLKAVFLVTTLLGVTGLWPAILADTGATVLVTANALRLLRAAP